jgi:crossover junction endodeoxyribonuclease RuvC
MSELEVDERSDAVAGKKLLRPKSHDSSKLRTPHSTLRISPSIVCLGIDPGLNRTGYAILARGAKGPVLREAGVIRSTPKMSLAERVLEIGQGLREVCAQYQPEVMAIEQVFSTGEFPKSALLMAHARGAILYSAADCNVRVVHYTPRQIKKLLTGSGKADKSQVQRAIANELHLDRVLEPHDVSDAAAVALCHYYSVRVVVM